MLTLHPGTVAHLLLRYKKATLTDLHFIQQSAERWLRENVRAEFLEPGNVPTEFDAIVILKVHATFGTKRDRNAGTFGSWNLIAPYRKFD